MMSTNQTHEAEGNFIFDGSNDPYVYIYDVPNLKEIASREVARGIWCNGLEKFQLDNAQDTSCLDRSVQLIKDLNIPSCIKDTLQNDLREVDRSIKRFAEHFLHFMKFPKRVSKYHYEIPSIDPNWLVWSTNGEIDCLKTAANLLQVDCLTNVHKFIIMSAYCMEDEMNKFSLDSLPAEFYADVNSSNGWVFYYWICYLRFRNELLEVEGSRAIAEAFNICDRFINQYFWSLLDDDDQVAVADYLISLAADNNEEKRKYGRYYTTCTCVFFGQIISKMNCNQRQRLFAKTGTGIYCSIVYSNSPRYVLCIWRRSKNHIKVWEFASIINELVFRSIHTAGWMSSLVEIWDTASDYQRNGLIYVEDWLNSFIHSCIGHPDRPHILEFLSKVLHQFSSIERKELILKLANSLFFYQCSPESFNCLVNSCLPHIEDQLALKKFVKQSHYFKAYLHHWLICDQEYEKFTEQIKFYCSYDASAAQVFKEQFLKKELRARHCCGVGPITNINKWNKFSEFIDETFVNDLASRLMVKQKYVSEIAVSINNYRECQKALRDCSDNIVKVVEMIFVDDDELKKVKRLFFHPFDAIEQTLLSYDRNRDRINRYNNTNPHTGQTSPFDDIEQLLHSYDRNRDRINRYLNTRMLMGNSSSGV